MAKQMMERKNKNKKEKAIKKIKMEGVEEKNKKKRGKI